MAYSQIDCSGFVVKKRRSMNKYVYIFCVMAWQVVGHAMEQKNCQLTLYSDETEQTRYKKKYERALGHIKAANVISLREYFFKQTQQSPDRVKKILAYKNEKQENLVDIATKMFITQDDVKIEQKYISFYGRRVLWGMGCLVLSIPWALLGGLSIANNWENIERYKDFYQSWQWVSGDCSQRVTPNCMIHVPSCVKDFSFYGSLSMVLASLDHIRTNVVKIVKKTDENRCLIEKKNDIYHVWNYVLKLEKKVNEKENADEIQ